MIPASIFDLPADLSESEIFEILAQNQAIRLERIISTGQTTPIGQWYDQSDFEWVILLQGLAEISFEDGSRVNLKAGDYLLIPPHQKHRVEFTSNNPPCIWLALHYGSELLNSCSN
jgi:cupin 2 domain-containing protein